MGPAAGRVSLEGPLSQLTALLLTVVLGSVGKGWIPPSHAKCLKVLGVLRARAKSIPTIQVTALWVWRQNELMDAKPIRQDSGYCELSSATVNGYLLPEHKSARCVVQLCPLGISQLCFWVSSCRSLHHKQLINMPSPSLYIILLSSWNNFTSKTALKNNFSNSNRTDKRGEQSQL